MDAYVEEITPPPPDMFAWMARIEANDGLAPLGIYVMLSMNIDPEWFEANEQSIASSPCYRHIRNEFARRMQRMMAAIEAGELPAIRIN
ncbi:hypothetical protein AB4Y36_38285 [Paraburkholderia sp. BR10936]|uniref:hypothetical protein n=1 Tax=Paraburkholderia sp. BR10936 TaxID=3236993 RepID=UPI0034D2BDB0